MKTQNTFIYITFLCAVFCFCWSTQDKTNVLIPTPLVLELRQEAEKCEKETGVPAAHLKKIIDKTLPDDTPNKKFFRCVTLNTGYTDNDGYFMVDKMASLLVTDGKLDDYEKTIKDCNKVSKGDPLETLTATADCIHAKYHFAPAAQQ